MVRASSLVEAPLTTMAVLVVAQAKPRLSLQPTMNGVGPHRRKTARYMTHPRPGERGGVVAVALEEGQGMRASVWLISEQKDKRTRTRAQPLRRRLRGGDGTLLWQSVCGRVHTTAAPAVSTLQQHPARFWGEVEAHHR